MSRARWTSPSSAWSSSSTTMASPRSSPFSSSGVPSATTSPGRRWPGAGRGRRPPRGSASSCRMVSPSSPARRRSRPHVDARLRVQARGRLVEEQHLRPVHEADGDVQLALHAAGVGPHRAVAGVLEAEALEQLLRPRAQGAPRMPYTRPCRIRFSRPVACGSSPDFCARSRWRGGPWPAASRTSNPATKASPASGRESVVRIFTVVDLPAPLAPAGRTPCPRGGEAHPLEGLHVAAVGLHQTAGFDRVVHDFPSFLPLGAVRRAAVVQRE